MKIIKYAILTEIKAFELEHCVNIALEAGWSLCGPAAVALDANGFPRFVQTLVRYEQPVTPPSADGWNDWKGQSEEI